MSDTVAPPVLAAPLEERSLADPVLPCEIGDWDAALRAFSIATICVSLNFAFRMIAPD
jgi:hypothetical protein